MQWTANTLPTYSEYRSALQLAVSEGPSHLLTTDAQPKRVSSSKHIDANSPHVLLYVNALLQTSAMP